MSFADFPVEVVYMILTEAVLEGDKLIVQANRLLQNGEARDNLVLPRLLILNQNIFEFLKGFLWRRIGLCRLNTSEPIPIDDFTKLSELYQFKNHHTQSINISLKFLRHELGGSSPGEAIQIASEIFEASRPSRINEVVLLITIPDLRTPAYTVLFWESIHPMLETITGFRNLTRFDFSFSQTFWRQEITLATVIALLESLEVIKLCASGELSQQERPGSQEDLGNSLSSLTRLKSMSLEGLKSLNPNWIKLNWRSKIQNLSINKCKRFKEFSLLKRFFHLFHKSLVTLKFEVEENYCEPLEDCEILRSFESLQQLTINQNHHRNISLLQQFSICPTIKFIHWIVSDLQPSKDQIRSLIYDLLILRNYQNRWKSLRSIILPSSFT
ncbi:hypothetical protein DFH28DRAFT_1181963, partial [Melampsora americana]